MKVRPEILSLLFGALLLAALSSRPLPGKELLTPRNEQLRAADVTTEPIYLPLIIYAEPDQIAFVATLRRGKPQLYLQSASASDAVSLTSLPLSTSYGIQWSPDGSTLAFLSDIYRLCMIGADARNLRCLAVECKGSFDWSPSGEQIAFSNNGQLWVINADGTGLTGPLGGPAEKRSPLWSPGGEKIAFSAKQQDAAHSDQFWDVFAMNADGSAVTNLTQSAANDFVGDWSPDGSTILFYRQIDYGTDIFVMNSDGTGIENLTAWSEAYQHYAEWSPDSQSIAYVNDLAIPRGPAPDIYVMARDGSNRRALTSDRLAYDLFPKWSPDGTRIAFLRSWQSIYVADADGSGMRNITLMEAEIDHFAWRP